MNLKKIKTLGAGLFFCCMLCGMEIEGKITMQDVVFREYDIRGKVGTELIVDEIFDLAKAIAFYLVQQNPGLKTVAVGMDGRLHSMAIRTELVRGLQESGLDVILIGVCPTPALYFAAHTMQVDAAIMITASHNPKEYNGMKICLNKEVVWGKKIQEIREMFKQRCSLNAQRNGAISEQLIIDSYVLWLAQHFKHLVGMKLSAVIDCGNGAAGTVLPKLLDALEIRSVKLLYEEVDGNYPHHEADPTIEKNMIEVKNILAGTDIAIGLGLDGDCDRMAAMTKSGFLVPGDQLLALFANQIVKNHPKACIIFDVKSSSALIEYLEKIGAQPCISPSGHAIIKDYMKLHHGLLGGELSCHFFFRDRYFGYDDGIYAAFRLFELLIETNKKLDDLLAILPKKYSSPEYRISCQEEKKHEIVDAIKNNLMQRHDVQKLTIDGVRATMSYGWGIIRVSNTQPALTMRFESDSMAGLQKVKQDFYSMLKAYFDATWLAQQLNM